MGYKRIKRLRTIFILTKEEAKEIDQFMTKIRKVSGNNAEEIMKRISRLIGGYSIESIRGNSWSSRFWGDTVAIYINKGDTYDNTILFNTRTKMPMITTMGDFVERNNNRYNIQ